MIIFLCCLEVFMNSIRTNNLYTAVNSKFHIVIFVTMVNLMIIAKSTFPIMIHFLILLMINHHLQLRRLVDRLWIIFGHCLDQMFKDEAMTKNLWTILSQIVSFSTIKQSLEAFAIFVQLGNDQLCLSSQHTSA